MHRLKQLHAHSLRTGQVDARFLIQKLVQIPNIAYARTLLDQIQSPSIFIYNTLIRACGSQKQPQECYLLYRRMHFLGCPLNSRSFMFLFAAFSSFPNLLPGRVLHAHFAKSGFESDSFVTNSMITMYADLGALDEARQLFDEMQNRDIPTWNAMITGYARCGDMKGALRLFELMPIRNSISWTAMISGFSQNGNYTTALSMFLDMEKDKTAEPNHVTIASVLPACANLGALEIGQRIEAYARENGVFSNLFVSNAVLEMYARCGRIDIAKKLFEEIGGRRNLCSWNSMINGLAVHGKPHEALELYDELLRQGIKPDDVTFVGLLLSCVHGGLVTKGKEIFESMDVKYDIIPKLEHYGCLIDLLGRAGELRQAYDLITKMPMKPDSVVWGALLGACSFHSNVEVGEKAAEALFKLEPRNPGNYIIMSNIYASRGIWEGVASFRKLMRQSRLAKAAGYSFIEENGRLHKFVVEDKFHEKSSEIYGVLNQITKLNREQNSAGLVIQEHELNMWE